MNPSKAPIALLGLAVCTGEHPDLAAFRHHLADGPAERPDGPGLADAADLLRALLQDGGIAAGDPLRARLGIFIAGSQPAAGTMALAPEGVHAVLTEYTGGHGAPYAVARAGAALCAGDCSLAAVLALGPPADGASRFEGSGVLLGLDGAPPARAYARLYPGLVREAGGDPAGLLAESCARAGVGPASLGLLDVEGHVGATLPIATVLGQLRPVLSHSGGGLQQCAVGPLLPSPSAVASMNGLCAVALALYERVLPPLHGNCEAAIAKPFSADRSPRPWIGRTPRRAGVLALRPGADTAIILEQAPGEPHTPPPRLDHAWPVELLLLSAGSRGELAAQASALAERAATRPEQPFRQLAGEFAHATPRNCRAALIARDRRELADKLGRLVKRLEASANPHFQTPDGIFFAEGEPNDGKTALMIPGQGSQYLQMFGDLCLPFPEMQTWFEWVDEVFGDTERCPPQFLVAPPAIGLDDSDRRTQHERLYAIGSGATVMLCGCLALHSLLARAGVEAEVMIGYSNGENAALIASDTWHFGGQPDFFDMVTDLRVNDVFERSGVDIPRGASAAVNHVPRDRLGDILAPFAGRVYLALDNCPDQVVLFGEPAALADVTAQLAEAGAFCTELPFDRGHHTPYYQPHADMLLEFYGGFKFGPGRIPLYSCITAGPFPEAPDGIRALAASQWTRCVRFGDTVRRLYDDGVRHFVEAGPGSRLSGFVHNTLRGHPHTAIPVNVQGKAGLEQLLKALGHLFAIGQPIDLRPLRPLPAPALDGVELAPSRGKPDIGGSKAGEAAGLTSPQPTPAVAAPANPAAQDGGAAGRILAGHFQLMQDFLAGQRRSHRHLGDVTDGRGVLPARARWPMLGDRIETGGGRLKARRTFTVASDPFLAHHAMGLRRADSVETVRGLPVVPFTFSMELVAEAAACLSGWDAPGLALSGLNAVRWLAADDSLTVEVEAAAGELPETREKAVHVRVFEVTDAALGRRALAFEGWARPAAKDPGAPLKAIGRAAAPRMSAAQLNARQFHGPLLKSICGVQAVDADGAELKAVVPPLSGLFRGQGDPALLTPAALLDAIGQLVFYWLGENGHLSAVPFPFHIAHYTQFGAPPPSGSAVLLRGRARMLGNTAQADVDIIGARGALVARVRGLKMKLYDYDDRYLRYALGREVGVRLSERVGGEWRRRLSPPPDWFAAESQGIWGRLIARVALNPNERLALRGIGEGERLDWTLARVTAKELALDWLEARGVHAHPADIEAVASGAGLVFHGDALRLQPAGLRADVGAVGSMITAAMTFDG